MLAAANCLAFGVWRLAFDVFSEPGVAQAIIALDMLNYKKQNPLMETEK